MLTSPLFLADGGKLIRKLNPRPPTSTSASKPLCNMRKHGFMIANTFFALHFLSFCFHSNGRSLYCLTALEFIPYISMHMRTYLCPYYESKQNVDSCRPNVDRLTSWSTVDISHHLLLKHKTIFFVLNSYDQNKAVNASYVFLSQY